MESNSLCELDLQNDCAPDPFPANLTVFDPTSEEAFHSIGGRAREPYQNLPIGLLTQSCNIRRSKLDSYHHPQASEGQFRELRELRGTLAAAITTLHALAGV